MFFNLNNTPHLYLRTKACAIDFLLWKQKDFFFLIKNKKKKKKEEKRRLRKPIATSQSLLVPAEALAGAANFFNYFGFTAFDSPENR